MNNKTLAIIKPDAVGDNHIGEIISMINKAGFKIKALKMIKLSKDAAKAFYEIHKDRPFYDELVEYMTSGPCVPIVLEKQNAVEDYRKLIGATDPAKAAEGTVRKLYAKSVQFNAVHGSDSDENAAREIAFFFSSKELIENFPM
ncbi:MAG: nucleoside-diphosphate kinase [Ignavibacteriota bacterium]|nr:MAG: nucleoside-diphosphate kinase [Ignavibacterium sp.]MBL1155519.1 nucleoside-diphosphate kinase [Ignavibacteriota bacterium]MCO6446963.1 nucleoside-diphosphate kinase [Ignavibacterium album]MCZ2267585.1 nucleoside-diphosphate kinase [Ignavibacteriales bacterium]MDX9711836.1 nucleoside-diphosphate kinase [Ignavibacteriaceae bacterium]